MSIDADLQKWWRQQADAAPPSEKELGTRALRLRRRIRNKLLFSIVLLAITAVFIWGVVYVSKPGMATTYAGTALIFLAIAFQLGASRSLLSLLLKEDRPDQDARHYLELLISIREKQKFLQARVLSLYFILLSAGIFLYMIEYARRMDTLGRVLSYGITGGWIALCWWVMRPRVIRKEAGKLNALIGQLEKIQAQLEQPEGPQGPEGLEGPEGLV